MGMRRLPEVNRKPLQNQEIPKSFDNSVYLCISTSAIVIVESGSISVFGKTWYTFLAFLVF